MRITALIATILAVSITGCVDTTRDGDVHYSGFLGDYSMLVKGDRDQAQRREIQDIMQLWAAYGSYNLCKLKKRGTCAEPKSS